MRKVKRIFDLICASIVFVFFWPILLIVSMLVRLNLGAPILFKQERVGINNEIFTMYKFRTMKDSVGKDGNMLPDKDRLTKFGKILRSTSLDELPEFINIFKGEMSLVGPRPLLVKYLPLYNEEQIKRHNVPPGLTGYAQVNGRNAINFTEKFKLDVWYVENWKFSLDIKIIFMTVLKVFKREGISQKGQETVEYFTGNN